MVCERSARGLEPLGGVEKSGRGCREIPACRRDVRVPEPVADERGVHAGRLNKTAPELAPQIVEMEVRDLRGRTRGLPRELDLADRFAYLVAKHVSVRPELGAVRPVLSHFNHRLEPRGDRYRPRLRRLGPRAHERKGSAGQIDKAPLERQELAEAAAGLQRGDDERVEVWRRLRGLQ